MPRDDDPRAAKTLLIGAIGIVLFFVTIVGIQALYYAVRQDEIEKKTYSKVPRELHEMLQEQEQELAGYSYIDQQAGIVAIPIERAMELVTRELAEK